MHGIPGASAANSTPYGTSNSARATKIRGLTHAEQSPRARREPTLNAPQALAVSPTTIQRLSRTKLMTPTAWPQRSNTHTTTWCQHRLHTAHTAVQRQSGIWKLLPPFPRAVRPSQPLGQPARLRLQRLGAMQRKDRADPRSARSCSSFEQPRRTGGHRAARPARAPAHVWHGRSQLGGRASSCEREMKKRATHLDSVKRCCRRLRLPHRAGG